MDHRILDKNFQDEVANLFGSVFTASAGQQEGKLIGNLASELSIKIDNQNIICFGTYIEESIISSIFFTRLQFNTSILVQMLGPVAVSTTHQGKGIGQALINHGLNELKNRSVSVVITYGDPGFYTKLGFQSLSEAVIQAPLKLSMPIGWLGQSLTAQPIPKINQRPTCVKEFNNQLYW